MAATRCCTRSGSVPNRRRNRHEQEAQRVPLRQGRINQERFVEFDWSVIWTALPDLMAGVKLTVFIAFVGLVGGFVVGVIAGMCRAYGPLALNVLAQVYIELIRGTPIVV